MILERRDIQRQTAQAGKPGGNGVFRRKKTEECQDRRRVRPESGQNWERQSHPHEGDKLPSQHFARPLGPHPQTPPWREQHPLRPVSSCRTDAPQTAVRPAHSATLPCRQGAPCSDCEARRALGIRSSPPASGTAEKESRKTRTASAAFIGCLSLRNSRISAELFRMTALPGSVPRRGK